ncbi:MAG: hypothetical protein ACI9TV_000604, partial [Sulfurimonas sp.]|uniref:hypothetical protein n=1 Tax=Sulfurimonas sp. TaxID=2022749 RepID=UPI0039E223AF
MDAIIGKVQGLEGKFFAKDTEGNVVELQNGNTITENMTVFGDKNNPASAYINVVMIDSKEEIIIAGNSEQTFDASLHSDETMEAALAEENVNGSEGVLAALEDDKTDTENEEDLAILDEDTAAGEEDGLTTDGIEGQFAARDAGETDIVASLRDAAFDENNNTVANEGIIPLSEISINDVTVNEDAGVITFTVSINQPSSSDITFDFSSQDNSATSESDFTPVIEGKGIIPAGQTSVEISLGITDDFISEEDETFDLVLTNASTNAVFADEEGIGTIQDEPILGSSDTVFVQLSESDAVDEATGATLDHTVTLVDENGVAITAAAGTSITVDLTYTNNDTESEDFGAELVTQVTIGETGTAQISNEVIDDVLAEGTEGVEGYTLNISNVSDVNGTYEGIAATNDTVTGTITDDDDTVFVQLSNSDAVDEATGATLDHTVTLVDENGVAITAAAGTSITVDLTYTNNDTESADFGAELVTQVTVDATGTAQISNTVLDDFLAEGVESYTLSISNVTDVNAIYEAIEATADTVTGTITDQQGVDTPPSAEDDTVFVQLSNSDAVDEATGATLDHTVTLVDENGVAITAAAGT